MNTQLPFVGTTLGNLIGAAIGALLGLIVAAFVTALLNTVGLATIATYLLLIGLLGAAGYTAANYFGSASGRRVEYEDEDTGTDEDGRDDE